MASNKVRFWKTWRVLRSFIALATLVVTTTISAAPAASGNSSIRFDAIVGYSGVTPVNSWYPVTCELQNSGPTFTGIIEISGDQFSKDQSRQLKIELPANTLKRVTIPVFTASRFGNLNIRLLDIKGRLLAEPNFIGNKTQPGVPQLGILPRNANGVPILPPIRVRNTEFQPIAVRLQPELFPDNPLVLEGLPVIYINSERVMSMTVPQVNALLAWMQRGGHLVIGVDSPADLTAAEWLNKILPCELNKSATITEHPELQYYTHDYSLTVSDEEEVTGTAKAGDSLQKNRKNKPQSMPAVKNKDNTASNELVGDSSFESAPIPVYTGKLRDGKVVLASGETPLVIQAQRGQGKITVLTFNPEREPFLSWKNRGWFWLKLTEVPTQYYKSTDYIQEYNQHSTDSIISSMIDSRQVRKLPLGWLLLLLVAYLVVIGPLDQYWLKKINKQMLTWITFPFYVVAFSALIYFIGFYLRAGELEYNELNIVDILPNNQLAVGNPNVPERTATVNGDTAVFRGQTYSSIYSPVNSSYPLSCELPFAALRGKIMNYGGGQNSRAQVQQHGNAFSAEAFVPVWTCQLFISDWMQPATQPFDITVTPGDKKWNITVINKSERAFPQTFVALQGRLYTLGKLAPHQTNVYNLATESGPLIAEFPSSNNIDLRSAAESDRQNFGNNRNHIDNIAAGSISLSLISMMPSSTQKGDYQNTFLAPKGLDLSSYLKNNQGVFFAWDENHSYVPPMNKFTSRRSSCNTLLRVVLPLKQKS